MKNYKKEKKEEKRKHKKALNLTPDKKKMIVEQDSYPSSPNLLSPRRPQYVYTSQWEIYAMGWSFRKDVMQIAIGSFSESSSNSVQILEVKGTDPAKQPAGAPGDAMKDDDDDVDEEAIDDFGAGDDDDDVDEDNIDSGNVVKRYEFSMTYPATDVMWCPDKDKEILATGSDFLQLWEVRGDTVTQRCKMVSKKKGDYCSPVTSIDWNKVDPDVIGSSSIDTTCSIWSVEEQKLKTQLIAHDKVPFVYHHHHHYWYVVFCVYLNWFFLIE